MWPFKKKPKTAVVAYILTPKEDVTAYEVALLLAVHGSIEAIQGLPDCALRHLTEVLVDPDTGREIHYRPALKSSEDD